MRPLGRANLKQCHERLESLRDIFGFLQLIESHDIGSDLLLSVSESMHSYLVACHEFACISSLIVVRNRFCRHIVILMCT